MKLAFLAYGDGPGAPLVVLHGLFGSGRNWGSIAKRLGGARRVLAADLRNHGDSPWNSRMDYAAMAGDVLELIAGEGLSPALLLGHSMGGKAAMAAALARPASVRALVVADVAPVAYAHADEHAAFIAAMQGLDLGALTRRAEADAALAEAVPDPGLRGFLLQNLAFDAEGPRWRLNLEAIAAAMPALTGWDAAPGAARYDGPALFVGGGRSRYIRPAHHAAIRALFPEAAFETVAGAGHWLHAEKPDAFLAAVEPFLAANG